MAEDNSESQRDGRVFAASVEPTIATTALLLRSEHRVVAYNEYQDSHNRGCTNAIGEKCATAILAGVVPSSAGECASPTYFQVSLIPECMNVFGTLYPSEMVTGSISGGDSNESVSKNGTAIADEPFYSGDGFSSYSGKASPSPNVTALAQAKSQLQMIILQGPGISRLMCTRVNNSIDGGSVSVHGKGGVDGVQTGTPIDTSTALTATPSSAVGERNSAVATIVGVAGFFVLFGLL